jgi:hypothetical protein
LTKSKADSEEIAETASRLHEFQRRWNTEGPAYVKAALLAVGARGAVSATTPKLV